MKRIIPLLLALLLLLSSCLARPIPPAETNPPSLQETTGPTGSVVTDPTNSDPTDAPPTDADPTDPDPTDAPPTDPDPTEPKPTEPKPTEPKPTEPKPTEPKPTEPPTTQPPTTQPPTTQPPTTQPPTTQPPTTQPPTTPTPDDSTESLDKWLYVNYIDVGQGDSILIKVGDCDILIDAGKSSYGSTVVNYLNKVGVDDIELMINTHPDNDHYGGLPAVLNAFKVEAAWGSPYNKTNSTYTSFKSQVSAEGISLVTPATGSVHTYGDLTITVLANGSGASNSNDSSLVLMFEYGSFRFLFTGDISSTIENKLVSSGKDLKCDVLKVGHHGSAGSSSSAFLNATGADYGVICVGADNSYGHPTSTALNNLSGAGISVYRTDLDGDVVFSTDGATLRLPGGSTSTSTGSGASGASSGSSSSGSSSSGSSSSGSSSSGSSSSSGASSSEYFIGNKTTKKFHLPTCSSLPDAKNQCIFYSYSFAVNLAGYSPCQRCLKNYTP